VRGDLRAARRFRLAGAPQHGDSASADRGCRARRLHRSAPALPQFDHRSKLQTWLFEICYRVAHAHRRKQRSAQALAVVDDELRATTPSPAERAEENERARLLFRLLSKLDEDKRMVLLLVEVEGMSAPEVADTLRLPLNTVYSRLRRARSEFSAAFEADARRQR